MAGRLSARRVFGSVAFCSLLLVSLAEKGLATPTPPAALVTHIEFDHKGKKQDDPPGPDTETSDGLSIRKNFEEDFGHEDYRWPGEAVVSKCVQIRRDPAVFVGGTTGVTLKARFIYEPGYPYDKLFAVATPNWPIRSGQDGQQAKIPRQETPGNE